MTQIIKRDGSKVPFDKEKIITAINKAFLEVDHQLYETDTANDIAEEIELIAKTKDLTVEEVQDLVEEYLMRSERKDVAKSYIRFRYKKEVIRERKDDFFNTIENKLMAKDVKNQNANMDEKSFGGRVGEASSVMTKQYALDFLMSKKSRENYLNNRIYEHDLDSYATGMHNCLSIPFDDLLAKGFNTRQIDVRPAQSVSTALQQFAVIFQLQSLQQFGGVSATHIDWTLVPYVRKSFYKHWKDGCKYILQIDTSKYDGVITNEMSIDDEAYKTFGKAYEYAMDKTVKEIHQSVEAMYHNLNTLQSRSGNQLPFTSINYGTCTLTEGRMITKALLEVSLEGLGKFHRTSIFPCGIFQCMKGVNRAPGDPNYDLYKLALKSTGQRLYPNYVNVDWSNNAGYDINDPRTYTSTMGCRTYNGLDINGLGQQKDGRGNIAPVTIIMPTLAMEAEGKVDKFFEILDEAIHDAKDMLLERFEWICSQSPASAQFMWENNLMAGYIPEEGIRSAMKHGTLVIGQLGLAETLNILIGKDHTTDEGMELAKKIEQLFKDRCAEFKQVYKLNFGVYYTPKL